MSFNMFLNQPTVKKPQEPVKQAPLKKEPIVKPTQGPKKPCKDHPNNETDKVCIDCLVIVCSDCVTTNHSNHVTRKESEAVKPLLQKLTTYKEDINIEKTKFDNELQRLLFDRNQDAKAIALTRSKIKQCDTLQDPILKMMSGKATPEEVIAVLHNIESELIVLRKPISEMDEPETVEVPVKEEEVKSVGVITQDDVFGSIKENPFKKEKIEKPLVPFEKKNVTPVVIKKEVKSKLGKFDIDPKQTLVKPKTTFDGKLKEELTFEILPKNSLGETISADIKSEFKVSLVESSNDVRAKIVNVGFVAYSEIPIEFTVRVIAIKADEEINGSPFAIKYNDDPKIEKVEKELVVSDSYELPEMCHFLGCFSEFSHEIMIKPNVMSGTIKCYDLHMKLTRSIEIPISAYTICADKQGSLYFGDKRTSFYKFDANLKKVWATSVKENGALGVCTDGEFVYGLLSKGPLFKMYMDSGDIAEKMQLNVPLTDAYNIAYFKDCFIIGDKKDIVIFDKYGFHIRTYPGYEHAAFMVIGDSIYAVQNRFNSLVKLTLDLKAPTVGDE
jgi:hypothetical protein